MNIELKIENPNIFKIPFSICFNLPDSTDAIMKPTTWLYLSPKCRKVIRSEEKPEYVSESLSNLCGFVTIGATLFMWSEESININSGNYTEPKSFHEIINGDHIKMRRSASMDSVIVSISGRNKRRRIEDHQCDVCWNSMSYPHLLDGCGHSFCRSCCIKLTDRPDVVCPKCRALVSSFIPNYDLAPQGIPEDFILPPFDDDKEGIYNENDNEDVPHSPSYGRD